MITDNRQILCKLMYFAIFGLCLVNFKLHAGSYVSVMPVTPTFKAQQTLCNGLLKYLSELLYVKQIECRDLVMHAS